MTIFGGVMKTKQFTIGYNWVVTIHEEYSLFKDLANEFKYSVVDSDNETITIFTVSNSHVDFDHTSYNLHPVVGFDDQRTIEIKHKPYEEEE